MPPKLALELWDFYGRGIAPEMLVAGMNVGVTAQTLWLLDYVLWDFRSLLIPTLVLIQILGTKTFMKFLPIL